MVARGGVLLVAGFVFFIDDDHSQVGNRRENRRARSHHHLRMAQGYLLPEPMPFGCGQAAVQDGDGLKPRREPSNRLRRQRDLRHQHDCLLAALHHFANALQVNFRLAAASDAQQKVDGKPASGNAREHGVVDLLLIFVQRDLRLVAGRGFHMFRQPWQIDFRRDGDQPEPGKFSHRGRGCTRFRGQANHLNRPLRLQLQQSCQDRPTLGRMGFLQDLLHLVPPHRQPDDLRVTQPHFFPHRRRQHRLQHRSQRRAIVAADPPAQFHQPRRHEHPLIVDIEQAFDARIRRGRMDGDDIAKRPPVVLPQRNDDACCPTRRAGTIEAGMA